MELNTTQLREQGRPLWMSNLAVDDISDLLGGGGDIWSDRLVPAWERQYGSELSQEEESFLEKSGIKMEPHAEAEAGGEAKKETKGGGIVDTIAEVAETVLETATEVMGAVEEAIKDARKKSRKKGGDKEK